MELHVLMAQRKCAYPGQYAPEALACLGGCDYSDNPEYLEVIKNENVATGDFDAVEIIVLTVDGNEVDKRLFPSREAIQASCV